VRRKTRQSSVVTTPSGPVDQSCHAHNAGASRRPNCSRWSRIACHLHDELRRVQPMSSGRYGPATRRKPSSATLPARGSARLHRLWCGCEPETRGGVDAGLPWRNSWRRAQVLRETVAWHPRHSRHDSSARLSQDVSESRLGPPTSRREQLGSPRSTNSAASSAFNAKEGWRVSTAAEKLHDALYIRSDLGEFRR